MALSHKYTLICDDVRQENNGKFIIIGLYTPNIAVPQLPFVLPSLTFFQWLEVDQLGSYTVRVKIENLELGKLLAQAIVMIDVRQAQSLPAPVLNVVAFPTVQFERAGSYMFSSAVDGQTETITVPFDVILVIPAAQRPPQR